MIRRSFSHGLLKMIFVVIGLVLSLPVVQAAGIDSALGFLGGARFFVINVLIIFGILFVLQAYLVPGKMEKEKIVVWIFIGAITLFSSWFLGSNYIWELPFLNRLLRFTTIVNTILLTVVLTVLVPLLKLKPEGGGGKGMWFLKIVVALIIALGIGDMYLWDVNAVRGLLGFLFGSEGILTLNPEQGNYRLIIFFVTALFLSWLFTYLQISGETKSLGYILAFLISGTLTHQGMNLGLTIWIAQIISILIIGNRLRETWGGEGWSRTVFAYGIAAVIVVTASYAIAPNMGLTQWFAPLAQVGLGVLFLRGIVLAIEIWLFFVIFGMVRRWLQGQNEASRVQEAAAQQQSQENE